MSRVAAWLQAVALGLGAPGLFLVAFLDSSFLSLPEVADLLVVWMVTQHHARLMLYVTTATVASVAGCLIMYLIGRKGGDALVRKRFAPATVDRTMGAFQRHGVLAVLIPAILPPPIPFKIFVLLAGVAEISVGRFVMAVAIGRGARYLALGVLALLYGERAMAYMHAHIVGVSLAAVGLLVGGSAGYVLWSRRRRPSRA